MISYIAETLETYNVKNWPYSKIGIFEIDGEKKTQVGEYVRNYIFDKEFLPIQKNGKWYALYSPHYTATRVMSLPDCTDLGGEKPNEFGFCPAEYAQLFQEDSISEEETHQPTDHVFVAGCYWGDDSCWKVEHIDISKIENGIIERSQKFGYIELPTNISLKDAINGSTIHDGFVEIACSKKFRLDSGKSIEDPRKNSSIILTKGLVNLRRESWPNPRGHKIPPSIVYASLERYRPSKFQSVDEYFIFDSEEEAIQTAKNILELLEKKS